MKVRKAKISDSKKIAEIHVKTWQTAYKYIVDRKHLDNLSIKRSTKINKKNLKDKNIISLVVENDESEVVGFLFGGLNRYQDLVDKYKGEIYGIYILEKYSQQGLGKKLVNEFFNILLEKGIRSVHVMFLAGNEAENFYYKLGARYVTSTDYKIGNHVYMVHSYGWEDISLLEF
jgi:ribosomal protein S18 acetylase RimI-like enzyme